MKVITIKKKNGCDIYKTDDFEFLGTFYERSYGETGESTGIFKNCKTRAPLTELGIRMIDGHYVQPCE